MTRGCNAYPRPAITWQWRSEALFMSAFMPGLEIGFINLFLLKCHTRGAPYAPWNEPKDLQVPSGWHNAPCSRSALLHSALLSPLVILCFTCNVQRKKKRGTSTETYFSLWILHAQYRWFDWASFIQSSFSSSCKIWLPSLRVYANSGIFEVLLKFYGKCLQSNLYRKWGVYQITPFNTSLKTSTVDGT